MQSRQLKSLVDRLNSVCHNALDEAGRIGVARTNYDIENEHWLSSMVTQANTDLSAIFKHFSVSQEAFQQDLLRVLDNLKTGNTRTPGLSPHMVTLIKDAWLVGSLDFGEDVIRSGHILVAVLKDHRNHGIPAAAMVNVDLEELINDFRSIVSQSSENASVSTGGSGSGGAAQQDVFSGGDALAKFTIDLTELAKEGKIDPIVGRDSEIQQIVSILCRRRQNNPILTGEAGVGKTAVVEGFAQRIVEGEVPPMLQDVSLKSLDLSALQAGAGVRGEFENRLKKVIEEVKSSPKPIIMFIDEAHNLVGAGGQAGSGDAANLLKPALARGELRTIAATTWAEYKKYFEEDAALTRRFQVVQVEEPDEPTTVQMIRTLAATLEKHHNIRIRNDAVVDSVRLSNRYITGRQLPDKAVSVIDTACARINLSQNATPPRIEDLQRRQQALESEKNALAKESIASIDHTQRLAEIDEELANLETDLNGLEQRWEKEKSLVQEISELYIQYAKATVGSANGSSESTEGATPDENSMESDGNGSAAGSLSTAGIETKIEELEKDLKKLQDNEPLVHACCDTDAIAETISAWTGIPLGRMVADEIQNILQLDSLLKESVIGQDHAIEQIAETIQFSRANLADPDKPIGVFYAGWNQWRR